MSSPSHSRMLSVRICSSSSLRFRTSWHWTWRDGNREVLKRPPINSLRLVSNHGEMIHEVQLTDRLLKDAMHFWMSGLSGWFSWNILKHVCYWPHITEQELCIHIHAQSRTSMCLSSSLSRVGYLSSLIKGLLRPVVSVRIPGLPAPLPSMNSPSTSLQDKEKRKWGRLTFPVPSHQHARIYRYLIYNDVKHKGTSQVLSNTSNHNKNYIQPISSRCGPNRA